MIDRVRLPPNKQEEALRLLDTLANEHDSEHNGRDLTHRSIWEVVEEINADLPADTWDNVPTDGSINLDHYLYGAPKKRSSSLQRGGFEVLDEGEESVDVDGFGDEGDVADG